MPAYKLYYFPFRGLADQLRLIFSVAGAKFEEVNYTQETWPEHKDGAPFGKMPILEVDGHKISESSAIARYLGRTFGLCGKTPLQDATLDMFVDAVKDVFMTEMAPFFKEQDEEKKKQVLRDFRSQLPEKLKFVERHLAKSSSGFIAGDKVTWADISAMCFWKMLQFMLQTDLSSIPHIKAHLEKIQSLPAVVKFYEDTKDMAASPMSPPKLD